MDATLLDAVLTVPFRWTPRPEPRPLQSIWNRVARAGDAWKTGMHDSGQARWLNPGARQLLCLGKQLQLDDRVMRAHCSLTGRGSRLALVQVGDDGAPTAVLELEKTRLHAILTIDPASQAERRGIGMVSLVLRFRTTRSSGGGCDVDRTMALLHTFRMLHGFSRRTEAVGLAAVHRLASGSAAPGQAAERWQAPRSLPSPIPGATLPPDSRPLWCLSDLLHGATSVLFGGSDTKQPSVEALVGYRAWLDIAAVVPGLGALPDADARALCWKLGRGYTPGELGPRDVTSDSRPGADAHLTLQGGRRAYLARHGSAFLLPHTSQGGGSDDLSIQRVSEGIYGLLRDTARLERLGLDDLSMRTVSLVEKTRSLVTHMRPDMRATRARRASLEEHALACTSFLAAHSFEDLGGNADHAHVLRSWREVLSCGEHREELRSEVKQLVHAGTILTARMEEDAARVVQRRRDELARLGELALPLVVVTGFLGMNVLPPTSALFAPGWFPIIFWLGVAGLGSWLLRRRFG